MRTPDDSQPHDPNQLPSPSAPQQHPPGDQRIRRTPTFRVAFLCSIGFALAREIGVDHPVGLMLALGTPLFAGGAAGVWVGRRLFVSPVTGAIAGVVLTAIALGLYLASAVRTSPECTERSLTEAGVGGQLSPRDALDAYLLSFPPLAADGVQYVYEQDGDEARFSARNRTIVVIFDGELWRASRLEIC